MGKIKKLAFFAENSIRTSTAYFHVYVFIDELIKYGYKVDVLGILPGCLCPWWFRLKRRQGVGAKVVRKFLVRAVIPLWRLGQAVWAGVAGYECFGMGRCMVEMHRVGWCERVVGWMARWRKRPFVLFYPDALHLELPAAYAERFRMTTHVVAVTPWLAGEVERLGHEAVCVRAAVNLRRYPVLAREGGRVTTIGFSGGPGNTKALLGVGAVLAEVARMRPEVRIKIVGKSEPKFDQVFDFEFECWGNDDPFATDFEPGVEEMLDFDIGLAPIAADEYALGKDSVKLRQYMALGCAVVGTDFGVNREVLRSWENGVLVTAQEEWVGGIVRLIDDEALRARLGEQARTDVARLFDVAVQAPLLGGALDRFVDESKENL